MARAKNFLKTTVGELTLGEVLKADRLCAELTQKQLGEKIGVTKAAISNFERGLDFPSYPTIKRIAKVFKMDEESYIRLFLQDIARKKGIKGYSIELHKTAS